MGFQTVNPATEEPIAQYEMMSRQEIDGILDAADARYHSWRKTSLEERCERMRALAASLKEDEAALADMASREMGKPISEALGEVRKCAWTTEVYAERAPEWLAAEEHEVDGRLHRVLLQPKGVIFAIMPWNFPFWQVYRFAVPTLLTGNTALLKHANNVPECALAVEESFRKAGFPEDVFRTLLTDHEVTAELMASDKIKGVSLTGSTQAGRIVGRNAGENLKPVVLELGGADPFIVCEDADIPHTARQAVHGRFMNCGQSCIASKRFIVHRSVAEEFGQAFAEGARALRVGDPADPETQIGPLVNAKALREIEEQFQDAVDRGGRVLCGGKRPAGKGFFFEPTVVTDTTPEMRIVSEEVFGPIAAIIAVDSDEEAIAVANSSEFGLGGSVWTKDLDRGIAIAEEIESGAVFVNSITKSDPRMPFGGEKNSGVGRELARWGMLEFANIKGLNVYDHK